MRESDLHLSLSLSLMCSLDWSFAIHQCHFVVFLLHSVSSIHLVDFEKHFEVVKWMIHHRKIALLQNYHRVFVLYSSKTLPRENSGYSYRKKSSWHLSYLLIIIIRDKIVSIKKAWTTKRETLDKQRQHGVSWERFHLRLKVKEFHLKSWIVHLNQVEGRQCTSIESRTAELLNLHRRVCKEKAHNVWLSTHQFTWILRLLLHNGKLQGTHYLYALPYVSVLSILRDFNFLPTFTRTKDTNCVAEVSWSRGRRPSP